MYYKGDPYNQTLSERCARDRRRMTVLIALGCLIGIGVAAIALGLVIRAASAAEGGHYVIRAEVKNPKGEVLEQFKYFLSFPDEAACQTELDSPHFKLAMSDLHVKVAQLGSLSTEFKDAQVVATCVQRERS